MKSRARRTSAKTIPSQRVVRGICGEPYVEYKGRSRRIKHVELDLQGVRIRVDRREWVLPVEPFDEIARVISAERITDVCSEVKALLAAYRREKRAAARRPVAPKPHPSQPNSNNQTPIFQGYLPGYVFGAPLLPYAGVRPRNAYAMILPTGYALICLKTKDVAVLLVDVNGLEQVARIVAAERVKNVSPDLKVRLDIHRQWKKEHPKGPWRVPKTDYNPIRLNSDPRIMAVYAGMKVQLYPKSAALICNTVIFSGPNGRTMPAEPFDDVARIIDADPIIRLDPELHERYVAHRKEAKAQSVKTSKKSRSPFV